MFGLKGRFQTNARVAPLLLIAIVGMIFVTSQTPAAYAGACTDEDRDGYYDIELSGPHCSEAGLWDCNDNDDTILTASHGHCDDTSLCIDDDEDSYYNQDLSPSYCSEAGLWDCNDNDATILTASGGDCTFPYMDVPVEIEEKIQALIADENFDINTSQVTNIIKTLEKAAVSAEGDQINVALNMLNTFINKINAHINSGNISQIDGDELIASVQLMITCLEDK